MKYFESREATPYNFVAYEGKVGMVPDTMNVFTNGVIVGTESGMINSRNYQYYYDIACYNYDWLIEARRSTAFHLPRVNENSVIYTDKIFIKPEDIDAGSIYYPREPKLKRKY